MYLEIQFKTFKSTHSLMDRTVVCGTTNLGSIPSGCTDSAWNRNFKLGSSYIHIQLYRLYVTHEAKQVYS